MICISTRSSIIRLLTIDVTTSTFVVVRPVYKPIVQRLSKFDLISHILAWERYDVFIYALNCYSYKSIPFSSYINKKWNALALQLSFAKSKDWKRITGSRDSTLAISYRHPIHYNFENEKQNTPSAKEIIKQTEEDIWNFEWGTWVHGSILLVAGNGLWLDQVRFFA